MGINLPINWSPDRPFPRIATIYQFAEYDIDKYGNETPYWAVVFDVHYKTADIQTDDMMMMILKKDNSLKNSRSIN